MIISLAPMIRGKYKSRRPVDGRNADAKIKYCPKCKRCWERERASLNKHVLIIHYDDFPSYGKEKQICFECE